MPAPTNEGRSWWARALSFTWEKVIVVFVVGLAVALLAAFLVRQFWPEPDGSVGPVDEGLVSTAVHAVMPLSGVPAPKNAGTKVRCRNASGQSPRADARQCLVYTDPTKDVALVKDPCFVASENVVDCVSWDVKHVQLDRELYFYEIVSPWWGEASGEPGFLVGVDTAVQKGSPYLLLVSYNGSKLACVSKVYVARAIEADDEQYICNSSPEQNIPPNHLTATENARQFILGTDRHVTTVSSKLGDGQDGLAFALDRTTEPWTISFAPRPGADASRSKIVAAYF